MVTEEESDIPRAWATACHLSALVGMLGIPFGNIIGPLTIWIIKRKEFASVDKEAKESLNFQISMTIYAIIAALFIFLYFIGIILLVALIIVDITYVINASFAVSNGKEYRYPFTMRFIK